jgi:small nuclear ribonucleoprotein G
MNANRVVIGTLRGFDQFMNLVVDNTVEVNGNDKTDIGMVVSFLLLKGYLVLA